MSVSFSPDSKFLATAFSDGQIKVYNCASGKVSFLMNTAGAAESKPMTCVKWRPQTSSLDKGGVLLSTNVDGSIQHW